MQADPVAQESGVPVLGISNTAAGVTDIGDYVFRDSLTEGAVIPQTIAAAQAEFGLEQVVVMYANDDAFTQSGYDAFASALDEAGIEVADTLTFSTADTDFAALLTQAQESEPDAIVVSALVEAAIPLVTQAREAGINGFNSPQLMADAGDAAEGVVVGAAWNSSSDNPENTAFLEAYRQAYDADPDQFAAQAYTGLYLIDAAIAVECSIDHEVLRDSLAGLADVPTVLGSFSFDENRDAVHPAVVQIVEDGAFVVLGGEEAAGGTAAGGDTAPADSATSDGTEVVVTGDTEPADTSSSDTDTASATTHG
jgi:branched-chain amino acid transport system substrate-binding protein